MNTRLKKISCSLAMIVGLFITTFAYAEAQRGMLIKINKAGKGDFDEISKELNLTPQQQQQITQRRAKEKQQAQDFVQKLQACRQSLNQELEKDAPDRAKVSALAAEMKELIGSRVQSRIEGILALKEILTPEQFKALRNKPRKFNWQKRRQS